MKITASNISMRYKDGGESIRIFEKLFLEVQSASSVAIVGVSGVGKTTLLSILGGLEIPTEGDVLLDDIDLTKLARANKDISELRGKHIGFIFQFHHLLPEFDALENVEFPLRIRGESETRKKAEQILKRVGLGHRLSHRPGALSGGEQQRVAIARAVVGKPGVILADEPTGNLDTKSGKEVMKILRELQLEENITLVLVTHATELARQMDRVVELTHDGIIEHQL
jgi:lipoprotein-releasing system ATP-binding protein